MAQGFLEPSKEIMVMEDIGNKYLKILLDKSFLQNAKKDEYGNIIRCKMHDFIYDFLLSISKSKSSVSDNFSQVRSLFVGFDGRTTPGISFKGDGFTKQCTLILENADFGNILLEFKSLRVLKLYVLEKLVLYLMQNSQRKQHKDLLHSREITCNLEFQNKEQKAYLNTVKFKTSLENTFNLHPNFIWCPR